MERPNNTTDLGAYNTAINVIGGLKDCSVIFKAIDSHFSQSDSLKELVNQRNEFNLRTEKSCTRIERVINFADKVTMLSENGAKSVIVPMDNLTELSNVPPTVLGNTDVPFYQNNQMLMQKAILLD